jgi:hypothetical protein
VPLASDLLQQIDGLLADGRGDHETLAALRAAARGLSASRCDWQDLKDETPFRSYPACELYLVDGRDHCWRITDDPACATGVVVAQKAQTGGGK